MSKMTFYCNTMFLLESEDSRVLCDPWITFDNYSDSGFYNFPKVKYLTKRKITQIKPDFIYISHTHPDHFDPITLDLFSNDTPVLVADYDFNFTERAIRKLGFTDVRVVPKERGLPLNGQDHVWMEPAELTPEVDSIAIFKLGNQKFVNANDNTFHKGQCIRLRDMVGGIDVGLLPSGAHGPWPMFFTNFSLEEKEKKAAEREQKIKDAFANYIQAFETPVVVPIAGGIIAAGEKVKQYQYSGIRPRIEVVEHTKKKVDFQPVLLSELNTYNFDTQTRNGEYEELTYKTESDYLEVLAQKESLFSKNGLFFIDSSQRTDLTRLLILARQTQRKWQNKLGCQSNRTYFFDVGEDSLYRLSLGEDSVSRIPREKIKDEEYDIFILPYELLFGILTRHYVWSNVNTQHMNFFRHGEYDKELYLFINYLQV